MTPEPESTSQSPTSKRAGAENGLNKPVPVQSPTHNLTGSGEPEPECPSTRERPGAGRALGAPVTGNAKLDELLASTARLLELFAQAETARWIESLPIAESRFMAEFMAELDAVVVDAGVVGRP